MRVRIKDIVVAFRSTGSVSKTAINLGISRPTVYRWLRRCKSRYLNGYIWSGIKRKSTKPRNIHHAITPDSSLKIISLRDDMHLGSRKIKVMLGTTFSDRTNHRLLVRKGKIPKRKNYRR